LFDYISYRVFPSYYAQWYSKKDKEPMKTVYYISGLGSTDTGGNETIGRLNMGLTVRIYDRHALGIQYLASRRDAHYPDQASSHQTVGTFNLVYTFLGGTRFGAVEWR